MKTQICKSILVGIMARIDPNISHHFLSPFAKNHNFYISNNFFLVRTEENIFEYRRKIPGTSTYLHIRIFRFGLSNDYRSIFLQGNVTRKWLSTLVNCKDVFMPVNGNKLGFCPTYIEGVFLTEESLLENAKKYYTEILGLKQEIFPQYIVINSPSIFVNGEVYTKQRFDNIDRTKTFNREEVDNGYSIFGDRYYNIEDKDFEVGKQYRYVTADKKPNDLVHFSST
jgi:hypothetical protein